MTALAFILAGVASALWYAEFGRVVAGPLTVWLAWFLVPLLTSGYCTFRHGDRLARAHWVVLAVAWVAGQHIWSTAQPNLVHAAYHVVLAGWFTVMAARSSELAVGLVYCTAVGVDALATGGIILGADQRPRGFVVFAYPDILAGISHAALILLASPYDGGSRAIAWDERRSPVGWSARRGGLSRRGDIAAVAPSRRTREKAQG